MRLKAMAVAAMTCALAALVWRMRPAPIVAAHVTSTAASSPFVAHLSLEYGSGAVPTTMIVDVLSASGEPLGSVTVPGGRRLLEVSLHQAATRYRVVVTGYYRLPWGIRQERSSF